MELNMTSDEANQVYDILIAEARAPQSQRDSFVREFTSDKPTTEWRFMGALGFGGKFRFPGTRIDCYPEDETPARRKIIAKTNLKLRVLRDACVLAEERARAAP
jgi:hypothetical protein